MQKLAIGFCRCEAQQPDFFDKYPKYIRVSGARRCRGEFKEEKVFLYSEQVDVVDTALKEIIAQERLKLKSEEEK